MEIEITEGVRVGVESFFQHKVSNPKKNQYVFAYRIRIENNSDYTIQLLRRHWYIKDGYGEVREVEGEGVVGEKPIINPGQSYEYVSGCDFNTEIGQMHGTYLMRREVDREEFYVRIPEFLMVVPAKLN